MIAPSSDLGALPVFFAILLAAGAGAGLMAGLLGVGGGMIIVPVLLHVFERFAVPADHAMHLAVGTSLATIIATSTVSARSHARKNAIDSAILRSWTLWLLLGVMLGSITATFLNSASLKTVFGASALLVAIYLAFAPHEHSIWPAPPRGLARSAIAGAIGYLSTLVGIGGGTFTVPFLVASAVPVRMAVGTAAAVGLLIAIPGTLGFMWAGCGIDVLPPGSLGYVNVAAFAALVPTTMLFAPLGARLAHAISPIWLRRAFAAFLIVNGTKILLSI